MNAFYFKTKQCANVRHKMMLPLTKRQWKSENFFARLCLVQIKSVRLVCFDSFSELPLGFFFLQLCLLVYYYELLNSFIASFRNDEVRASTQRVRCRHLAKENKPMSDVLSRRHATPKPTRCKECAHGLSRLSPSPKKQPIWHAIKLLKLSKTDQLLLRALAQADKCLVTVYVGRQIILKGTVCKPEG